MKSYHGLLVVDKPGGLTSRAVVDRALRWFPRGTRIGHTGTLDPLATGVLVLCVGVATRLTEYVQRMDKVYRADLLLGARSTTDDADGVIEPVVGVQPPDRTKIAQQVHAFIGEIEQVPPAFSAAKVTGRRAYDLARQGQEIALEPRCVRIDAIDLLAYEYPRLELEVRCGKGTYIRALARDLGERLGCGALVATLRRLRIGRFEAKDAIDLEADAATARSWLLPVAAAVAELPRITLNADQVRRLRQGQNIPYRKVSLLSAADSEVGVFDEADGLIAVAWVNRTDQELCPTKVFP